jgi:maltooligosyltrehalose trehalohydrolase
MIKELRQRQTGINFLQGEVAYASVWAPFAHSVEILNNNHELPLTAVEMGYWEAKTTDIKPGDTYWFRLDGSKVLPDPASLFQPAGVHGPSQTVDLTVFNWNDNQWSGIEPKNLIIYEVHPGTFTAEGTFEGIAGKLKYLKDLGITAIEIMPIAQFPGSRNWGYDGVFPFAVQNSYGGPVELQRLVDASHQTGLAVILDVVYNHLGPEGNYLSQFGPYFTDKYKTPWGMAINFDDEWSDGVRKFYIENALMWFRDFHIDGLRLDAVHAIKDFGAKHFLLELRENVDSLNALLNKHHILIGESDLNDVRYINLPASGGYGLDMQWCDEFHHALHALVTGERSGYYTDFGDTALLVKSYREAYVFDGIYSNHRKRIFGNKATGQPGYKFIVFAQNHDHIGNRMLGERLSVLVDYETLKLIAGAVFVSPYIPLIFMGEEYGETHPFLYFTSHEDEELVRMVREGRKNEFTAFMSKGEPPDPQAIDTFHQSKLQWNNHNDEQLRLFNYYSELIRLKKHHPVLQNTNQQEMEATIVENKNAIILIRRDQGNLFIALMNFETEDVWITLSDITDKRLYLLLNSVEESWSSSEDIDTGETEIKVSPRSMIVLSDIRVM